MQQYFTYILRCADDTLYTGFTNDLEKRIQTHNAGKWAKYTRGRLPVVLVYSENFTTESEARKREYAIKQMKKTEKLRIIQSLQ